MTIDGKSVDATTGRVFRSLNPYTGEAWAVVPDGGVEDIDAAVAAAGAARNGEWGRMTGFERAAVIRNLADLIDTEAECLARYEVNDSGKLFREMSGQMTAIALWYRYFAGLADKIEGRQIPTPNPNYLVYTRPEPVGVVAAITPWNSPLLLLTWKLAPALAVGCTAVVKPSEHSPVSTLAFADLFARAGFPPGVVNVVSSSARSVGAHLSAHPGVHKVAFTGSTASGQAVAKAAAANLNRATLELGGKSAHLVFPDADLAAVANGVIAGVFAAAGQTCMAGSRLVVHDSVHDQLVDLLVQRAATIKLGDPNDPATEMGPLANQAQFQKVTGYLETACNEGAHRAYGGTTDPRLRGLFVQPTILTKVAPDSTVAREEVFGPVLSVFRFMGCGAASESHALSLANDTPYGLAGAVWTKDIHRAHRVAHRLRAGTVWINAYRVVSPSVPFGGFGLSGLGRENGIDAINEYMETKAVWVELTGSSRDPFTLG